MTHDHRRRRLSLDRARHGLGFRRRGVRVIAALLALEIALAVAAGRTAGARPVFATKLFIDAHA
jgi:hypothetical protein